MKQRLSLATAACVLALGAMAPAHAQSDREVVENADAYSASVCPGYDREAMSILLRAVNVGALRVLAQRGIVICPDRRLTADAPAVWYGNPGAFVWHPDIVNAGTVLVANIDSMTRNESFPVQALVWSTDGVRLTGRTIPAFESRPGARLRVLSR
jgi:hypothetical protein